MKTFTYRERTFYKASDLIEAKHPCMRCASKGMLVFIKRKALVEVKDYVFAKYKPQRDIWTRTKSANYLKNRDKVLIAEEWANQFICKSNLPPILKLEDHELFRDDEGEAYKVEVRGERHYKKCFFKAKDVALCFNLCRLTNSLTVVDSAYVEGEDYMKFHAEFDKTLATFGTEIYLTYAGLLRVMMVSRVGCARRFLDWAMETLFAAHLGTTNQKAKLVSNITGIDYSTVSAFCSTLNTKISAIYLFKLGKVKDLKDILNIPDTFDPNATVYKYGKTNDIQRRFKEHLDQNYSKDKGFDTKLELIWFVDRARYTEAENEVKEYMIQNGYKLDNLKHTEIAIIKGSKANVAKLLNPIFCDYSNQIFELENKISNLLHEIELLKKDIELHKKDVEYHKKDTESYKKDIELLKREKELAEAKLELTLLRR